ARDVGKLIATIVTGSPNEATEPFPDARVSARDPAHVSARDSARDKLASVLSREIGTEEAARPSDLSCPTCGGVLREAPVRGSMRSRCRVGPAFSPESPLAEQ